MKMKKEDEKIAAVTAYDYSMAKIFDSAGIDLMLVGDSMGMVIFGEENTLNVSISDIIRHTRAVVKGNQNSVVVADMPFLSFQVSLEKAVENAGEIIQKTGCSAVKIEGGYFELTKRLVNIGIPVVAHLGFTPQSVKKFGRNIVRGKSNNERDYIIESAHKLQKAGASILVLEAVPENLAEKISKELIIPVIGIGSGRKCDGEIQVCYDILGLYPDFKPKHAKVFSDSGRSIKEGIEKYIKEVKNNEFPGKDNVLKK
ncbi:MAG: 3-methyl-2-oxobutanoate hydroxymethyltransferase [Candidatus Mcinerneyibacterium aminivorans]|uniref:3-methyl-2-oxobutanoate hydroxymethyltransferase n=1 Tax=Candidatus Mcinerneyibacterium aminivorans TaxID=2703815 RepID=A0A5D0ME67_9BACT|nr:MAG: 3-methyl-2-oxobutanoate hydroxymethyltransferase [Candidatus Mcinerneyibacterium aminivorans]